MPVGGTAISVTLLRVVLVALAICWMPIERVIAEPVMRPDLADRVGGTHDMTFADLVRLVVPAAGDTMVAVREIGGEVVEEFEPASIAAPRLAAVPVHSGGLERMAVLLDFGSGKDVVGLAVLALFDIAGEPRLLDAANVASGNRTYFLDPARLPVGADGALLAIGSTHVNSSQSYTTVPLVLVRDDRLELVDFIFVFDERACGYERTQRLALRQGASEPFADIVASVTEVTTPSGHDCGEAAVTGAGTRTITVTYRWDSGAQRYNPELAREIWTARISGISA